MPDQVSQEEPLLEVTELKKYFPIQRGFLKRVVGHVKAVDGVSFHIMEGETLGLVGESGCGKTTTGRSILRAIPPTSGQVMFKDPILGRVDVSTLEKEQLGQVRRSMRMIFQDPYTSLNPRMTLLDIVGAPLRAMGLFKGKQLEDRVAQMLQLVGLSPEYMRRYPHAFSGGQRQRIAIARALATKPEFIAFDEPTSALDVSVQAQILNLLKDLKKEFGLTYLYITHELLIAESVCDYIAVMYLGKVVEMGTPEEIFHTPRHPYAQSLVAATPVPDPKRRVGRIVLPGEVPSPANPPPGCTFHPRCSRASQECRELEPPLEPVGDDHYVACFHPL